MLWYMEKIDCFLMIDCTIPLLAVVVMLCAMRKYYSLYIHYLYFDWMWKICVYNDIVMYHSIVNTTDLWTSGQRFKFQSVTVLAAVTVFETVRGT